jgi:rubredoxin
MAKLPVNLARCQECLQTFTITPLRWQPKPRHCSLRCVWRGEARRARADAGLPAWFPAVPVSRTCPDCGETKNVDLFGRRSSVQPEYVQSYCISCRSRYDSRRN